MNIFEIIGRTEPIHTKFLVASLKESAKGDRSLFEAVWGLVAPSKWEIPECPEIMAEFDLGEKVGRIDVAIRSGGQPDRIVGIEIKTVESSTEEGQLKKYLEGLKAKYSEEDIAMAYLTPFNEDRAAKEQGGLEAAKTLPTVREFNKFADNKEFPRARHVSWLDVADIRWDGNALWEQHRQYVCNHISASKELHRNRALDVFFGPEPAQAFMEALEQLKVRVDGLGPDINIDLKNHTSRLPQLAEGLVDALRTLVRDGDNVSRNLYRPKKDKFQNREVFHKSDFRVVHEALFGLADRYRYVWVQGTQDYAIRVAHKKHGSGVSLIRSVGESKLQISGGR